MRLAIPSWYIFATLWLHLTPNVTPVSTLPNLSIIWNESAKENFPMFYVFMSKVTYTEQQAAQITDGVLMGLAKQAYQEMTALPDYRSMKTKSKEPAVMVALKVDNEVFFASSIRAAESGVGSFLYRYAGQDPFEGEELGAVTRMLVECQAHLASTGQKLDKPHRVSANCGEPMALHAWMVAHPNQDIKDRGARMAAYGTVEGKEGPLNGCRTRKTKLEWGCHSLADFLDVGTVDKGIPIIQFTEVPTTVDENVRLC